MQRCVMGMHQQINPNKPKELKRTTWIVMFHAVFLGMQYSCIYTSLFFYLRDMLKMRNSEIYYGVIISLTTISSSISEVVLNSTSSFISIRTLLVVFILLTIAGNLFYALEVSIWFVYIGAFLCGSGDSTQIVIFDNFIICYETSELSVIRSRYEQFYTIGFVAGPLLTAMLSKLNIYIGKWHFTKYNGIGFILAVFLCVVLFLVLWGVSNITTRTKTDEGAYDEENRRLIEKKNYNKIVSFSIQTSTENIINTAKSDYEHLIYLSEHMDLLLIMLSSLTISFVANVSEILITVSAATEANLDITSYSIMLGGCLIVYAFLVSKLWNFFFSHRKKREFSALLACLILSLFTCGLILLTNLRHDDTTDGAKRFFLILAVIINSTTGVSVSNACLDLFFKHVPIEHLEAIEQFRALLHRTVGLIGLVFSGLFYRIVFNFYVGLLIFNLVLIMALIIRRKHLVSTTIPQDETEI